MTAFDLECARCKRFGKPQLVKNPAQLRVKPLPVAPDVATQAPAVQPPAPSGLAIPEAEKSQHPLACAFCNNLDVQKLSVIVKSGITRSSTSGTTYGAIYTGDGVMPVTSVSSGSNTAVTQLASALSPPPRPILNVFNSCLTAFFIVIGFVILLIGLAIVSSNTVGGLLTLLIGACVIIGMPYSEAIAAQKRKEVHAVQEATWQRNIENWDCLFYCPRCDHVYDPRYKRYVPSHLMYQLL
ncbi:hypothetical protein [Capsulimonas corticalis]|nr:hypothetical protein [Capsulimonas corticalis]